MRKVHERYPDDLDAATYMSNRSWTFGPGITGCGRHPAAGTAEASDAEKIIARDPYHPGALHLYIHILEMINRKKAKAAADKLRTLMPGAVICWPYVFPILYARGALWRCRSKQSGRGGRR